MLEPLQALERLATVVGFKIGKYVTALSQSTIILFSKRVYFVCVLPCLLSPVSDANEHMDVYVDECVTSLFSLDVHFLATPVGKQHVIANDVDNILYML